MATHIQIGDVSPRIQYTADGTQTEFTYPFAVFRAADLEAYFDDTRQSTGYVVTGAGDSAGGTVTFTNAPTGGVIVTLARRLIIERLTDFQESGEFRSKVLNDELDYLTAAVQQVAHDQRRSAQVSLTETTDINVTLPAPQVNRALVWNGAANGFANGPTIDEISSAQSYAVSAQGAAVAAAAAQVSAASSATTATSAAQAAVTAAASNMYASNASMSASFSVLPTDDGKQFLIDTSAGNVTVTLPEGATAGDGFRVALAKTSADNNAVLVIVSGTDTINGGATWQFSVPHGQSVIALDTTPSPDTWFAAGIGLVAPIGISDIHENAKPYDIAFVAGFDSTMTAEAIAVQTYAEMVMCRSGIFIGEAGYLDTASVGTAAIFDILKNGMSIYTVLPQFAATSNMLAAGTLKVDGSQNFVAGDRITFKVTQTGTSPGKGMRVTVKGIIA